MRRTVIASTASNYSIEIKREGRRRVILIITPEGMKHPKGGITLEPLKLGAKDYYTPVDIDVMDSVRNSGLGSALYKEALKFCKSEGFTGLASLPALRNSNSDKFWIHPDTTVDYHGMLYDVMLSSKIK